MKIIIDIPKEFERHFQADKFEDSLHRLSADAHLLAGNYEQETVIMLINAFKYAVQIEETTNAGRIRAMTDEELSKLLSKNCPALEKVDCSKYPVDKDGLRMCDLCWLDWLKQEAE